MRLLKASILTVAVLLAACAAKRPPDGTLPGYVEIDNPGQTMNPNAPAKIWVPRSYVESGPPRGGDLVKQGSEKVMQAFHKESTQPVIPAQQPVAATAPSSPIVLPQQGAGASMPTSAYPTGQRVAAIQPQSSQSYGDRSQAAAPVSTAKIRIAILDPGQNGLGQPLYENLRRIGMSGLLDPAQTSFLAQYANLGSDADKASFATRLQQDYGANVLIYISAPEGMAYGKPILAEVYDTLGGGLLRRFDAVLSFSETADQSERNAAIATAMGKFTDKIKELVAFLPWYGRISVVEGSRAYVAAGKEAGICVGQVLKIYHGGKFIKGLGFAPGEQIGTVVIQGFVGPNGSFGQIMDGHGVQPADLVAAD
ncbi:MAG TPA: hypothetical protein VMJ66_13510 [Geobacteraceae bacterium]|nr:hypothetical protein [Geobacteraceae bacterium]